MDAENKKIFIEIGVSSKNKHGEIVCGDTFLSKKIAAENRYVAVLSDGLGSGIKASVLSTMTASMGLNFSLRREPIQRAAESIMKALPVDSLRGISYSTFSIADIDADGEVEIAEYDNPRCILLRKGKAFPIQRKKLPVFVEKDSITNERIIWISKISLQKEDRLIFYSDGVTQSGMGNRNMPFGWGEEGVLEYAENLISKNRTLSARNLAKHISQKSEYNDIEKLKDDTTCAVIYVREPRRLLICTGPPYSKTKDKYLAEIVNHYRGKKIICGGTTSLIIARELKKEIETSLKNLFSSLPPTSKMDGIDLITEGILTLGALVELLENNSANDTNGDGPAYEIFRLLIESDIIDFVVGTKINEAHQDPSLPIELEIRRNVVKRIRDLLEEKFLKEVRIKFI